jgi:hypothetical protein
VWGALIIAGVVPFLTFFMLCTKDQMAIRMDGLFGSRIDAAPFITNLNQMIRGFVAGNLIVGSVMAVATTLVLWSVGMKGALPLGIASGLLNLLPFLGLIAALALPLAAALLQIALTMGSGCSRFLAVSRAKRKSTSVNRPFHSLRFGGSIGVCEHNGYFSLLEISAQQKSGYTCGKSCASR